MHQSLQAIEQQIEDQSFIRVSRNTLLNLNYVEKFKNSFSGTSVAILNDGTLVNISRRFWKMVKERGLNQ
ncbi:LytTR family DNA-binding domain-containing protein [Ligilactobacillus sp. LYQ135]